MAPSPAMIQGKAKPPPPPPKKPNIAVRSQDQPRRGSTSNISEKDFLNSNATEKARSDSNSEKPGGDSSRNGNAGSEDNGAEYQDGPDKQQNPDDTETSTNSEPATKKDRTSDTPDDADHADVKLTGVGRPVAGSDGKFTLIDEAKWDPHLQSGPVDFAISIAKTKGKDRLTIKSPLLLSAIDVVIDRKGDNHITKSDDSVSLIFPYVTLYFQYENIVQAAKDELEKDPSRYNPDHLVSLQYWHEKWLFLVHSKIKETIKSGWVAYDQLWALFQPGGLVYAVDEFKQPRLYVVTATTSRGVSADADEAADSVPNIPFLTGMLKARFVVELWFIDWDSSNEGFKRARETKRIESFSGSRRITDLEFYPLRYYREGNQQNIDELMNILQERGQRWKALVSDPPICMDYDGPATEYRKHLLDDGKSLEIGVVENRKLNDRVVVDMSGFKQFGEPGILQKMNSMFATLWGDADQKENPIMMGLLDNVPGAPNSVSATEPFSDLQAQLSPSALYCCLPRTTTWYSITVAHLKAVNWQKSAIEALVLHEPTKQLLCDLVEEHKKGRLTGSLSDFIRNKGEALIMVLHGPPGVGKTLTAEAIAEYTEKPLYAINIGEFSKAQRIVSHLETVFELSRRWDAVLLIDEADVVLEARSYEDLERNAIVSVFLRMLEYYRGILFMTTNRLGTMDIAFQSRVSLAIRFTPLTPELRRQIWLKLINRIDLLETECRAQLLERLNDIAQWPLNGRQIRNVLSMAESMALVREKRRGAMRFSHVEQVVDETLRFQGYFEDVYRESRSKLSETNKRSFREKRVTIARE